MFSKDVVDVHTLTWLHVMFHYPRFQLYVVVFNLVEEDFDYAAIPLQALYTVAGISCILLSVMWCCVLRFFIVNHPYRRFHDSNNYRLSERANPGRIICCFLMTCCLFIGLTIALIFSLFEHYVIESIANSDFEVSGLSYIYMFVVGCVMTVITFFFLLVNCLCYFPILRHYVGKIC